MNHLNHKLTAKEIMQQLANEPSDHEERIPMSAIIKSLSRIQDIDKDLMGRFWQLRGFDDNVLGHGIDQWSGIEAKGIKTVFTVFATAMELMKASNIHPYDAMLKAIELKNASLSKKEQHKVMASFVECETLAAFVYWCPVNL